MGKAASCTQEQNTVAEEGGEETTKEQQTRRAAGAKEAHLEERAGAGPPTREKMGVAAVGAILGKGGYPGGRGIAST